MGLYWDNGEENGKYQSIVGLYWGLGLSRFRVWVLDLGFRSLRSGFKGFSEFRGLEPF